MADQGFELIMAEGRDPSTNPYKPPLPPKDYARIEEDGLVFERNVPVKMRDGVTIYVDIFRPAGPLGEKDLGVLLGWSPYGKHGKSANLWPPAGIEDGWNSRHTAFEAPDPAFWCPLGYAVCYPDPRGAWLSEGELRHNGLGEGEDCYDLIEYLGVQPWSNGKVGMTGVSYLAAVQWLVAPLKPPTSPRSTRGRAFPTGIANSPTMAAFAKRTSSRAPAATSTGPRPGPRIPLPM